MTTTTRDFTRLPKWAQDHIEQLERRAARAAAELAALRGGEPTTVGIMPSADLGREVIPVTPQYQGETRPTVQFTADPTLETWPDAGWLHARVVRDHQDTPWLEVRGDTSLIIKTDASNSIRVKITNER